MKVLLNSAFYLILATQLIGQVDIQSFDNSNYYANHFEEAYQLYPNVPRGILESVAYNHTHIRHIQPAQEAPSCIGLPASYGVMGLVLEGQDYFRNNLLSIAENTIYTESQIIKSPRYNILAYAEAYQQLMHELDLTGTTIEKQIPILINLSELPYASEETEFKDNYVLQTQIYGILDFLNQPNYQQQFNFPERNIDLAATFGDNYPVLSSSHVVMTDNTVETIDGIQFNGNLLLAPDYPPAIWDPTTCNYSSRSGTAITAVTIHTTQGSYAGSISWFKNCNANASAPYVIRSSDGQVTQMVLEADKAWHVGSENPYTIGIEHEGWIDDSSWYTEAMYESSADLVKDIVNSGYGINPLRTHHGLGCTGSTTACGLGGCIKIKGHQHFPNQTHTDPGINWDWKKYYDLINDGILVDTETAVSGTACDSGGSAGNYGDDERTLLKISPANAISITLDFTAFDLELDWDYLTIYDGATVNDPVVANYTGTTGPGILTLNNAAVLIEFRSDCATTNPGYCFDWTAVVSDIIAPTTSIDAIASPVETDFIASFTDTDNMGGTGIDDAYFLACDFNGVEWRANGDHGFAYDDFSNNLHTDWINYSGTWSVTGGSLIQSDVNDGNSNLYIAVDQNQADSYLYNWKGKITGSGTNQRAGIHFFCDNAAMANRGNSYFMYFRESSNKLQLYKVVNDTWTLEVDLPYTFNLNQNYDFKIFFNKVTGVIDIYVDGVKALSWTDAAPHTVGNHVSFRSGNCAYTVDEFRVYKSRSNSEVITVANESTAMIRYENTTGVLPGGIHSIVRDLACNVSTEAVAFFDVDFDICPIDIHENGVVAPGVYQAANGVHSSGVITSSLHVSFLANYIDLLPGFESNTDFNAEIDPCN